MSLACDVIALGSNQVEVEACHIENRSSFHSFGPGELTITR